MIDRDQGEHGSDDLILSAEMDEPGLINFFVDLTGQSESSARSVVMYLDMLERDFFPPNGEAGGTEADWTGEKVPARFVFGHAVPNPLLKG
ncbi:MAG: hypothetical protein U1G07_23800 [Verrucomicrobiota bacterium]